MRENNDLEMILKTRDKAILIAYHLGHQLGPFTINSIESPFIGCITAQCQVCQWGIDCLPFCNEPIPQYNTTGDGYCSPLTNEGRRMAYEAQKREIKRDNEVRIFTEENKDKWLTGEQVLAILDSGELEPEPEISPEQREECAKKFHEQITRWQNLLPYLLEHFG